MAELGGAREVGAGKDFDESGHALVADLVAFLDGGMSECDRKVGLPEAGRDGCD